MPSGRSRMYNLPQQLLVKNPINRYLINSPMLPDLKRDADGGLTIDIQAESPGKDRESNWLPAPWGPFVMFMRYYRPQQALLDDQVFRAETDIIGTLTRTALNGPEDVPNVKALQSQLRLQPLSAFLGQPAPAPAPAIAFPPYDKTKGSSLASSPISISCSSSPNRHIRRSETCWRALRGSASLPDQPFDAGALDAATREQLEAGVADAKAALKQRLDKTFTSSGMFGSRAELGDDYVMRRNTGAAKGCTETRTSRRGTEATSVTAASQVASASLRDSFRRPRSSGPPRSIPCRTACCTRIRRIGIQSATERRA